MLPATIADILVVLEEAGVADAVWVDDVVADAVKLGVEIMTEAEVRLEKELKNVDPMELGLVDAVTEEAKRQIPEVRQKGPTRRVDLWLCLE